MTGGFVADGGLWWPNALPWADADLLAVGVGVAAAVLIWLHAYPVSAEAWRARLRPTRWSVDTRATIAERLGGAAVFGFGGALAAAALGLPLGWLGVPRPLTTLVWTAATAAVLVPIVAMAARKPALAARYPEVRESEWTPTLASQSLGSTAAYLLGYEVFFRGLLVFGWTAAFGVWPGLAAATAVYVAQHLRKDANEAFSCLPMGFVFGVMALQTGSIWGPWAVHVLVAATNEVVCARRNPAMHYPL